jgi:hypothetical protein
MKRDFQQEGVRKACSSDMSLLVLFGGLVYAPLHFGDLNMTERVFKLVTAAPCRGLPYRIWRVPGKTIDLNVPG